MVDRIYALADEWALAQPRRAAAACGLAGFFVASLVWTADLARSPSFGARVYPRGQASYPLHVSTPLQRFGAPLTLARFELLMLVMWVCYLLASRYCDALPLRWTLAAVVLLHVVFLFSPPTRLTDAFNYLGFARLGAAHGLSPYSHHLSAVGDHTFRFASWHGITTPYGPLFTVGTYAFSAMSPITALWTFKTLAAAASLGCVALIRAAAERLGRPVAPAVALFGLNPMILVYGIADGHNDLLMLMLMLAGIWAALLGRERAGGASIVAAGAVKAIAVLPLPFMLLAGSLDRRRLAVAAAAAFGVLLVFALVLFGGDTPNAIAPFISQAQLRAVRSVPGVIGKGLLGLHDPASTLGPIFSVGFVAVTGWLLVRTHRHGRWIENTGWAMVALLLCVTWLMPWYVAWAVPFAALGASSRLRNTVILFTLFSVVLRIPHLS